MTDLVVPILCARCLSFESHTVFLVTLGVSPFYRGGGGGGVPTWIMSGVRTGLAVGCLDVVDALLPRRLTLVGGLL